MFKRLRERREKERRRREVQAFVDGFSGEYNADNQRRQLWSRLQRAPQRLSEGGPK